MGRVWKARDEVLHRDVAIKELVPPPGLTDDERREMRERSLREARAIARLNHINVVRIFDVLRTDGDPWIVMEYVPSRSLQDMLAEDGPVDAGAGGSRSAWACWARCGRPTGPASCTGTSSPATCCSARTAGWC